MLMLVTYILDKIDSIDGIRGSKKAYHQAVYDKFMKQICSRNPMSKKDKFNIDRHINNQIMKKTEFRYKLLIIRAKIGFSALVRK